LRGAHTTRQPNKPVQQLLKGITLLLHLHLLILKLILLLHPRLLPTLVQPIPRLPSHKRRRRRLLHALLSARRLREAGQAYGATGAASGATADVDGEGELAGVCGVLLGGKGVQWLGRRGAAEGRGRAAGRGAA